MQSGIIMLTISAFVAGLAWLVAAQTFVFWSAGIVTFLFMLLGGLCFASEVGTEHIYHDAREHDGDADKFGGERISGSWQ